MAVSEIYDNQNRSGVMGLLYITYFSDNTTLTHCLTPAITNAPIVLYKDFTEVPYYHITWNIEYRHLYARKGFSRLKINYAYLKDQINDAYLKDLQFQSGIIVEGSIYGF